MKINKLFKVISLIGMGIITASMLAGCGGSSTSVNADVPGETKDYIVMGTSADFKPFEYIEEGNVVGFDVEIAKAIADKLGKELKVEDMSFDSLLMGLDNGKMDFILAGLTATDTRKKQVDFSDSYFKSKQMIIVKADNTEIKSADDLQGKSVGVQSGTTSDLFVSDAEGVKEVVRLNNAALAVMDLKNGKIDAVVVDAEPAKMLIEGQTDIKVLDAPFAEEEYAVAVKKGNTELLDTINEVLKELKANGEYDKIHAKYFDAVE